MAPTENSGLALPAEIEGALNAHRRMIELIVTLLGELRGDALSLVQDIERRVGYRDHHEDPGSEPDIAFAVERASDDELRRLLRNIRDAVDFKTFSDR